MKTELFEYYPLSKDETQKIFEKGLLILDTNVLMKIFQYSAPTQIEWINFLNSFREKVWLPYQIAIEFQRSKFATLDARASHFTKIAEHIDSIEKKIEGQFQNIPETIKEEVKLILKPVYTSCENVSKKLKNHYKNDEVQGKKTLSFFDNYFSNKVGEIVKQEELEKHHEIAKKRFSKKIPPGYKDDDKEGDLKFGDYLIWVQMIEKAKSEKRAIFFITDDQTEDWWQIENGKKIGPRPELRREFWNSTQQHFWIQTSKQFFTNYAPQNTNFEKAKKEINAIESSALKSAAQKIMENRNAAVHGSYSGSANSLSTNNLQEVLEKWGILPKKTPQSPTYTSIRSKNPEFDMISATGLDSALQIKSSSDDGENNDE